MLGGNYIFGFVAIVTEILTPALCLTHLPTHNNLSMSFYWYFHILGCFFFWFVLLQFELALFKVFNWLGEKD